MTTYRTLGRTGVQVSPLTLGTMNFGAWGNPDHEDSAAILHRALDAGINVVDTADVYSRGESETIVGKALAGRRDDVVLATKVHGRLSDEVNHAGNSRRWIVRAVEDSLRRLQTDRIDVYQVHRPQPGTAIDETLGALDDLVRAGKVLYVGTSTFLPSQIVQAQWVAADRRLVRPVTEQPPYSILARGVEREVLPLALEYGLGVLPWSPLAGGWLSGRPLDGGRGDSPRHQRQPGRHDPSLPENRTKAEAVQQLSKVAEAAGLTLLQLALGFVLEHPAVSSAIIGPRTQAHLDAALTALDVRLSADVLDEIDRIVPPGVTLNPADAGWHPPSITDASTRRR
ncbi:aldo/keto reductase [Cellulomonas xiejunii]|uniref:Aldo/keto reductase n=1 Tax=Cellulomonas xiejunii TaxID=2968083 RepID=A0ABY5KP23_9CELL|nr:aldo/keto reductase [Cellulomonas xiejunii]MCC2320935.1 aldo/keto reductase [Cellulomonas xiejunii]UUI71216.1 aldo/keto reductase [Cellulomonas xiejunii]